MRPAATAPGTEPRRGIDLRADVLRGGWLKRPHPILGYVLFSLAVFLVALAYSLPHDLIAARILSAATAGAPVTATFRDVTFAFPNGYRFSDLRLEPARAPGSALAIDTLTVRTPLLGLLLGRPRRASLSGSAYGGEISGDVEIRGGGARTRLEATGIELARALAPLVPAPGRIAGRAELTLELSGDGRTTQSTAGSVALAVRGLELREVAVRGVVVPDLDVRDLTASGQILGSRMQVKEVRATSDAGELAATGDVLLRDPLPQSVLNLRLTVDVRPDAPPALRVATALLPRRNAGEKPFYTVSGTVAAPSIR